MEDIILYFALKYEGNFTKILTALEKHELFNEIALNEYKKKLNCEYVTLLSASYPSKLKQCSCPPFVLFYKGNIELLKIASLGVIGSRFNTKYGKAMCEKVIPDLVKKQICIVSGLAYGIDGIAHQICLDNKGNTIAVLGNGFDYFYPKENQNLQQEISKYGLIVSEYPPFTPPNKENFPARNRLIATLSDALLVVEAKKNSGTMITVNDSLNMGKDVMCFPKDALQQSGCNELIKNGAFLVENTEDILSVLGFLNETCN